MAEKEKDLYEANFVPLSKEWDGPIVSYHKGIYGFEVVSLDGNISKPLYLNKAAALLGRQKLRDREARTRMPFSFRFGQKDIATLALELE